MLKQRIITALILAPIVICGLFLLDPIPFSFFVAFVTMLGAWEWANLSGYEAPASRVGYAVGVGVLLYFCSAVQADYILFAAVAWWVIAFILILSYPSRVELWQAGPVRLLIGLLVLVPFWKALVFVRSSGVTLVSELNVLWVILYMLLLVWTADVGAYFAGKAWGKSKLAPDVSPGKSWAGAWGGVACVALLAALSGWYLELSFFNVIALIVASTFTAGVSIVGDLAESMFKRHRGIKDSSNLLPGHGGVMDRIDSLTAAVPVLTSVFILLGWMA